MGKKKALVTGITGQDGSYLAEHLLSLDYEVHGLLRHSIQQEYPNIENVKDQVTLQSADPTDQMSLYRAIEAIDPDEIYNLGAMSFVPASWTQPIPNQKIRTVLQE